MERVALITGGARGIARAVASALARDGWRIATCFRHSETEARALVAEIERGGGRALATRCDVSDPAACEALVAAVDAEFGRIDALVHGAGPYHKVPLVEETEAGWREMFDHNVHPVFTLNRLVAPGMRARGWGRIVAFSMAAAEQLRGMPSIAGHYAAKAALLALVRAWAVELAADGITVNAVSPGYIDSGSTSLEELEPALRHIPAGRLGRVEDCSAAVQFLLGEDAGYVTGANLTVSGGWGV